MTIHPAYERALVAAARRGHQNAFSVLVMHYRPKIYRLALKITRSHEDAEDVVQDAWLSAYCHLQEFEGDARFYTWLARITMNQALMKLRKYRSHRQIPLDEAFPCEDAGTALQELNDQGPEQQYAQRELQTAFSRALTTLNPRLSKVLWLQTMEDLTIPETAERLRLSVPATKSRLLRGRHVLSTRLRHLLPRQATASSRRTEGAIGGEH